MAMKSFRTDDLRAAYMPGAKKLGSADVSAVGLTYCGKPVEVMEFSRHGQVRYYRKADYFCFAAFDKNRAALDD